MTKKSFILPMFLALPLFAADSTWVLKQSALTYHVAHPLHQTDGMSHAARGKGVCHQGQCEFLIAVPVKTFDSGDSNRDLHMIQVTRGAEFPMVTVRTRLPESASTWRTIKADLEIQFAGQTAHYHEVPFEVSGRGGKAHHGHDSGHPLRFQDRPAFAAHPAGEERNSGESRYDLDPAVTSTTFSAPGSCQPMVLTAHLSLRRLGLVPC